MLESNRLLPGLGRKRVDSRHACISATFYTAKHGQSFFMPGKATSTMVTTAVVHGVTLRGVRWP